MAVTDEFTGEYAQPIEEAPKKKRGRAKGQPIVKRAPLSAEAFQNVRVVTEDEKGKLKKRREERGEQQEAIDEIVRENYKQWRDDSGQTLNWADMPVIAWVVPRSDYENLIFMLNKALRLEGRKMVWGTLIGYNSAEEECPVNEAVNVLVSFCVIAKPPKKVRSVSPSPSSD